MSYAARLRLELSERNQAFAHRFSMPFDISRGSPASVLYKPEAETKRHGNFHAASYRQMMAHPEWARRFNKVHSHRKVLPPCEHGWKELDSCNSSDALLMNVFCYPRVLNLPPLEALLNLHNTANAKFVFGFKARVPLVGGKTDQTEVDLLVDDLLVESKLTEPDFQDQKPHIVERYADLREVFDVDLLPRTADGRFVSYQLIRNVLAAYHMGLRFCVFMDQRRPDLREAWHDIQRAIKPSDMRVRCLVLTWQELAAALPRPLQKFLAEKYGIAD